jgi:hypothetical protein
MALSYIGEKSLLVLCPSVALSLGVPAIAFSASFSGNVALNASLSVTPPTVAIYLSGLAELQAQLNLAIGFGAPSFSFTISDVLSFQVQLEAALTLLVTLEGYLSASIGMYAFTYSGVASGMGGALTSELATSWPDGAPTTASCDAWIFGAVSSIAQTQIAAFLNGLQVASGLVYTAKLELLAAMTPVTNAATAQGSAGINAQLSATASLSAGASVTPPTLAIVASALVKAKANLVAQLNVAPPKIQAAINATAKAAVALDASFGLLIDLGATLSGGSVFVYKYTGAADVLGAAVTSALSSTWGDGHTPTSGECLSVILATTDTFSAGIVGGFFGGA